MNGETPSQQRKIRIPHVGLYRFSVAGFLVSLVFTLVVMPFLTRSQHGEMVESVLLSLVLISAVLAVGHQRRVLWLAAALVTPALICKFLTPIWPSERMLLSEVCLICSLIFVLFIILQLLRFILRAPHINSEVLCAGVSAYLLLGMVWSFAFTLVAIFDPHAFNFSVAQDASRGMRGITSFYFSFVTLSTVGYGDITPVADVARMLAAAEAVIGTLFVAVLISRLVSMYSTQSPVKEHADKN